jgi:hypothetical protein
MTDPRYDPRFQRGWDGDPAAPAERTEPPAAARTEPAAAPAEPEPAMPDDEAWIEASRRNPFRIALAVTGVALLAIGGWLAWVMVQDAQNSSTPMDPVLSQLPFLLTPSVVLAGLVAIIAAIAVGGRRR